MKSIYMGIFMCLFLLYFLCITGCQSDTQYHHYQPVASCWDKQDSLNFELPAMLLPGEYTMEIEVRHTGQYPYRDLWLILSHPLSPSQSTDTLHLYLAQENGSWKGVGKSLIQFAEKNHTLKLQEGDSLIQITHIMQENPLKGITDIGIRLFSTSGSINAQKDKEENRKSPK